MLHSRFPGGESLIRIEYQKTGQPTKQCGKLRGLVTLNFKDNGDIIDLMLLADAVRRHFTQGIDLALSMDYLPYARQDRVCNPGESLSVKVIADIINSLKFSCVYVKDIHSEVGVALLDNLHHIKQMYCASPLLKMFNKDNAIIISPDNGAIKKAQEFAKFSGIEKVICAEKTRDLMTGNITGISFPLNSFGSKSTSGRSFIVLDDICDGGRTFVELAKKVELGPKDTLSLFVTHGIFSQGVSELKKYYSTIYTANLMNLAVQNDVEII